MLAVANLPVANPVGMQQINFQVPFEVNGRDIQARRTW